MLTGLSALEKTDWSCLHHAYGRATDTPQHLRALLGDDEGACEKAFDHLFGTVIHQGTPFSAAPMVAQVLIGLFFDASISEQTRIRALGFFTAIVTAADEPMHSLEELEEFAKYEVQDLLESEDDQVLYDDLDAANAIFARTILDCRKLAPILFDRLRTGVDNANQSIRLVSIMGVVDLVQTELLSSHSEKFKSRLLSLAREVQNSDERSSLVLALGKLGVALDEFLQDTSPAVRICAAIGWPSSGKPSWVEPHEGATKVLLLALNNHADKIDSWFDHRPPQFLLRPRFVVLRELLFNLRIEDFDRIALGAEKLARITSKQFVDYEWGPLLQAAFPDHTGIVKTDAQRRFLAALVENAELWDPKFNDALRWLKQAGLPYNRENCAKRVQADH